ncbi:hypothetical protein ABEF92_004375 [Exophiala dermatitidis]|uniref:Zn(2)-C6 fungal-type domain-containing protein n=1 Tax=Exophiala dermatitidis (strain ATCC 34100 / CBS 525.76 / NIH/UT8656) TaxID=858893 RepID=H6BVT5_EXODN|nr:uncharacterized protein HMPREF1120_03243 [Exophiala dermatitidis NIH/UT8656]EHY55089.1 hypothetical protein HMPREF1120_03243 [Exophiala dermatitidis NIH/UT8656]
MEEVATSRTTSKRTAPTSRGSSAYARKRAVIACQVCRARRTKCDQKKPTCSFCESIGAECVSDPPALSAFDPASVAIIERLDRLERRFTAFADVPARTHLFCQQPFASSYLHHLPYQNVDQILKWPALQEDRLSVSPNASARFASSPSCVPWGPTEGIDPAAGNILDTVAQSGLVDRFFLHVHSRNPILDEKKTRALAQLIHDRGMIGWDTESCLMLLVWANGALGRPLPTPAQSEKQYDQEQATALFLAAQQRLGPVLMTAGIMQAQCLFLAGVFLMSSLRPFDAWRMFLQALTMCRTFEKTMSCDATDTVAAESVYWSAWKSERELYRELWSSADPRGSGLAHDHPRQFPSLPADCEGESLHTWYFYLSEISAWRLESHVEEEIARFAAEGGGRGGLDGLTEIANSLMQQAREWQNSLAPKVSLQQQADEYDGDMLRLILRARVAYIQDKISWPFIYAILHDNMETESPRVRNWAAKGLSCHLHKLEIHRIQFYHRHHGTWVMIRSCARSTAILLAAARQPFSKTLLPSESDWRGAVEATLEMLRFWQPYVHGLREVVERLEALYSEL